MSHPKLLQDFPKEMRVALDLSVCKGTEQIRYVMEHLVENVEKKICHKVDSLTMTSPINRNATALEIKGSVGRYSKWFQWDPLKKVVDCSFAIRGKKVTENTRVNDLMLIINGKTMTFDITFGCLDIIIQQNEELLKIPRLEKENRKYRKMLGDLMIKDEMTEKRKKNVKIPGNKQNLPNIIHHVNKSTNTDKVVEEEIEGEEEENDLEKLRKKIRMIERLSTRKDQENEQLKERLKKYEEFIRDHINHVCIVFGEKLVNRGIHDFDDVKIPGFNLYLEDEGEQEDGKKEQDTK